MSSDSPVETDSTAETAPAGGNVRVLMAVVIGLGVLLIVGFGIVIGTIVYRASNMAAGNVSMPRGTFGELAVEVPADGSLIETTLDGDRLLLRVGASDGEQLIVVDLKRGLETGRIRLSAAGP